MIDNDFKRITSTHLDAYYKEPVILNTSTGWRALRVDASTMGFRSLNESEADLLRAYLLTRGAATRQEARLLRVAVFNPIKPCINGHMSARYENNSQCLQCLKEKRDNRREREAWTTGNKNIKRVYFIPADKFERIDAVINEMINTQCAPCVLCGK
jgi:hypothetical protein